MVCEKNEMLEQNSMGEEFGIGGKILIQEADDDINISGIAGNFPDADGLTEFAEKLFNKVDLISDDDRRWKLDHPEIPQRTGKLKQVNKFDASSFGIHYNQAQSMDPMTRILLEKSYEAIIDSGYNPYSLRGSRTGVFVGACFSESEKTWFYEKLQVDGFGVTGCIRTMLANRISYAFGFDGPSYVVDTACSSSMYALEQGYNSIREGHCDAAIVGGCNLCLHPYVSLQFARLGVLSLDGKCKVFDESANGYCRSEAIAVVFLQKKKDCRRIYANVVHVKTNCDGYKEQGITYPSGEMQQRLLQEFYEECMIDPASLAWVEAHGTGTKVGDPEEVRALYNIVCKNRKTPLQIGSVKSNLGHAEPSSGMCSIAKVIIAMETGLIPPNINFKTPRSDIEYFHTGEIQVVTEPTPWNGGMVGVNSFGFGGANCHALLKWNEKSKKNGGCPEDDIPRLVNVSGRTVEAVDTMLGFLEKMNLDTELVKLFHDIHKEEIPSHLYRGFTILTKNKSVNIRDIQYCGMKKPLYMLFSSQYSKWKSFDKSLLEFPAFSQSLSRMSKAISIDILQLITNPDISITNPINFFVSTIASQIALYDLLQSIGIVPHAVIGISLGGLVCAYIDGYLSIEETIIIAYNLALIFNTSSLLTDGNSAAETKNTNNVTADFLKLSKLKIIEKLDKILQNREPHESKWLNVYGKINELGSSEFIYQNIITSLDVTAMNNQFPEDCLLLNVGPKGTYNELDLDFPVHAILNSVGVEDTTSFLTCVGKLFMEGVESNISKLYNEVDYPVSRSTPMIAPLVRWNHEHDWYVTSYRLEKKIGSGERTITISLSEDENEYISGHVVDGRNLFPATGYLALVWETVGLIKGEHYTEVPVVFEDVRFLRATNMSKDGSVNFTVIVQRASGNFEVVEGGAPIVTGRVYVPKDVAKEVSLIEAPIVCNKDCTMSSKDIYKELRLRGYNYKGLFKSLVGVNIEDKFGIIRWQKNWVAFMDNMLQIQILYEDTRGLFVPTSIEKVVIDGRKHVQSILSLPEEEEKDLAVYMYKEAHLIKSGGVEIRGLRANPIARKKNLSDPILETNLFVPNISETQKYSLEEIVRIFAQIIVENENVINVRVIELHDKAHQMLAPIIAGVLSDLPLIQPDILVLGTPEISDDEPLPPEIIIEDKKINNDQTALLVAANNILNESQSAALENCLNALKPGGYLITREFLETDTQNTNVTTLCSHIWNNERVMLLRKNKKIENERTTFFNVSEKDLSWIIPSQNALKSKEYKRVVFVGMDGVTNGALGLVNCLRKEPEGQKARCFLLMDDNVPAFSLEDKLHKDQLSKDMAINVYKNGEWGTYRHLKLNPNNKVKAAHIYANSLVRGDLSSLSWIKGPISDEKCLKPCDDNFVNIHYASLNFRDVMLASGKLAAEVITKNRLDQQCFIGFEFSGVAHDGSRYMGMINSKALASVIESDPNLVWKIPDHWTLEDAATIPCTYGTALFSLVIRGKMKKGDTVLIHAGSGGVGQAAIYCALAHDCIVFTTVGTPEKRNFIKETFPQIKDSHIGNSRDTSFEQMVMKETNGRGVDIVLNSLAEEKLLASVRCLAKGGRFLEIGKFDLSNNNPLSMEVFAKGASFYGILLDAFFEAEPEAKKIIGGLITKHIANHTIKPLCRHVFKCDELETAFRFMSSGKHIGKVLIKMRDEQDEDISNSPMLFDAVPRFYCDSEKSYIIIGGLGGFGLELADWLVLRGATRLVLTSRKGLSNGYQSYRIKIWKSYGVDVKVLTDDVVTPKGVENIINVASSMGPVAAIFNLAVILKDGFYENQTEESFQISLGPKALATKYLDEKSRELCPTLDHFVVFSSVSCGRGNAAQTNYGMANSIMERICEKRVSEGLPGTAIQWGAVGDVGIVADMMDDNIELVIGGTLPQRITSCMEIMDQFLTQNYPIVASMVVAEKKSGHSSSDNIVDTVVNILGIRDLKTVSFHSNLAELGMDSMMAVEIKQTLEREFEVYLSPQDIRGMTIAKLQELASAKESSEEKPTESNEQEPEAVPGFEKYLIQMIAPEPEKYEPIIKLNSGGVQSNGSEVFMIPGIEGFPIVFEHIAKQLDYELYGLQFDYTTNHNKVSDIAELFIPIILPYLKRKTFNIVGYSYGGLIGIDLVRRLENLGFNGKLILIDSTPEMMISFAKNTFSNEIDDNLEVQTILRLLDNAITANRKSEIETLLREAPDWDSKVQLITNLGKNLVSFSETFLKQLLNSGLNRVISILNHEGFPEKFISATVTLIRPTEAVCPGDEDYGLSKHCLRPVSMHFVEGNHVTVLTNPQTATIISEVLSSQETHSSKTSFIKPPTEISKLNDPSKQV